MKYITSRSRTDDCKTGCLYYQQQGIPNLMTPALLKIVLCFVATIWRPGQKERHKHLVESNARKMANEPWRWKNVLRSAHWRQPHEKGGNGVVEWPRAFFHWALMFVRSGSLQTGFSVAGLVALFSQQARQGLGSDGALEAERSRFWVWSDDSCYKHRKLLLTSLPSQTQCQQVRNWCGPQNFNSRKRAFWCHDSLSDTDWRRATINVRARNVHRRCMPTLLSLTISCPSIIQLRCANRRPRRDALTIVWGTLHVWILVLWQPSSCIRTNLRVS